MQVKVTDNSKIFKNAKDQAVARALENMGKTAERHAKEKCPVDTGRLRNSITHATTAYSGQGTYTDREGNSYSDATATGTPKKNEVYIGTNVEYAKYIEEGSSRNKNAVHFLRDAAANHSEEYKRIMEIQLKKG